MNARTNRDNNLTIDNRVIKTSEDRSGNVFEKVAVFLSYLLLVILFPIAIFFCVVIVAEFQRAVVLRLGRLRKGVARGPGVIFVLPCVDDVIRVDLRTASFDVPAQEILTKDSVTIKVDAIVYFRIRDPLKAVLQVVNAREATQYLAQTTLRTIAGTKMLIELLTSREQLSNEILVSLDEATDVWGVKVERVEIRDIKLPQSMQRALAQEAQAIRQAKAKIISAEGEMEASKALKAASDIMKESPLTLQLRYMQTLTLISQEQKSTIIFPVPVDLLPPDIGIPPELQRAMAAEQEAIREAKAKIAAADGELQSSTVLKEASETMAQNPIALQLRYLQTLSAVSAEKNHTVVVPFPLDIIRKFSMFFTSGGDNSSNDQNSTEKGSKRPTLDENLSDMTMKPTKYYLAEQPDGDINLTDDSPNSR